MTRNLSKNSFVAGGRGVLRHRGFFVRRQADIRKLLADSPQKYVVTDLVMAGLSPEDATASGPDGLPPKFTAARCADCYPWSQPVVFRAGRYLVHAVRQPIGRFGVLRR